MAFWSRHCVIPGRERSEVAASQQCCGVVEEAACPGCGPHQEHARVDPMVHESPAAMAQDEVHPIVQQRLHARRQVPTNAASESIHSTHVAPVSMAWRTHFTYVRASPN
jgi:hypothetical protein